MTGATKMISSIDELSSEVTVSFVRGDPRFSLEQINRNLIVDIHKNDHLNRRERKMEKQINDVTESVQQTINRFGAAMDSLVSKEAALAESTKKVSGSLRDHAQEIGDGLARVEKTANFDRLERYVALLERASAAMQALAELESTGKLDKIASAIR